MIGLHLKVRVVVIEGVYEMQSDDKKSTRMKVTQVDVVKAKEVSFVTNNSFSKCLKKFLRRFLRSKTFCRFNSK